MDDYGYGIFYLDAMDHLDRYIDKTIKFKAMVLKPENSNDAYFVPGRMAMTCCADDMAFLGYACKYDKCSALNNKDWVESQRQYTGSTGKITMEKVLCSMR